MRRLRLRIRVCIEGEARESLLKQLNSHQMNSYNTIGLHLLLLFTLFIAASCGDDDQIMIPNRQFECSEGIDGALLKNWYGVPQCLDLDDRNCDLFECNFINIKFLADSTYSLSYNLIFVDAAPGDTLRHEEEGRFGFECTEKGVFTNRSTYRYVEGILSLNPDQGTAKSFPVRQDDNLGLQLNSSQIGLGSGCGIYLLDF